MVQNKQIPPTFNLSRKEENADTNAELTYYLEKYNENLSIKNNLELSSKYPGYNFSDNVKRLSPLFFLATLVDGDCLCQENIL